MKINYSETRTLGTVATWQRCALSTAPSGAPPDILPAAKPDVLPAAKPDAAQSKKPGDWPAFQPGEQAEQSAPSSTTEDLRKLSPEQAAELQRLVNASGVLQSIEVILPDDAILEGVHWTLIVEDEHGPHKIIGKCARNPNLPLEDTDPLADEKPTPDSLNHEHLGKLLAFLQPFLKSGFAPEI